MYFVALATDFDGTIARGGAVDAATIDALREVRQSGRKLILVTGRDLPDLRRVFSEFDLFDLVVAENGALLFDPATKEETPLAEPPSQQFVDRLRELNISPLSVGSSIVATWEPNQKTVLEVIHELGLELHIIFNKGAVMVLPGSVNKASGLKRSLKLLGLSPHNVVGIGDAENDQAFLGLCGCSVAVDNALDAVKAKADLVVAGHGAGAIELARLLVDHDMRSASAHIPKARAVLGTRADSSPVLISPFETILITGSSGGGKSTVATALLEQIRSLDFQFCVVDPEGDYAEFTDAVIVGDSKQEPRIAEVMSLLAKPDVCVVVNLLAINPSERPHFLAKFLPEIAKLRSETGRPHWLVLDEVHHCLPAEWEPASTTLPKKLPGTIAITVHPEAVARHFLDFITTVVGVGEGSLSAIEKFCVATGRALPDEQPGKLENHQVHLYTVEHAIEVITPLKPKEKQKRHARKYAEGELGEDKSFYFRGPSSALNLRAQNLSTFVQMADGVDDETWLHHLRLGEYSSWFENAIKDNELAAEAQVIAANGDLSAKESRRQIKEIIERRYTAPAKS